MSEQAHRIQQLPHRTYHAAGRDHALDASRPQLVEEACEVRDPVSAAEDGGDGEGGGRGGGEDGEGGGGNGIESLVKEAFTRWTGAPIALVMCPAVPLVEASKAEVLDVTAPTA